MLVLARQRDETIMIGDDIEVTVVDIRGDKVRLGINAPKDVSVHRKEVWLAIRKEAKLQTVDNVMVKLGGKIFRCPGCGANMFRKFPDFTFECKGCRTKYKGTPDNEKNPQNFKMMENL